MVLIVVLYWRGLGKREWWKCHNLCLGCKQQQEATEFSMQQRPVPEYELGGGALAL